MNNKIYKKVGLLSISALAAFSLVVPVKAVDKPKQSCTEYTNYYFFNALNKKSYFNDKTTETSRTGIKYKALPKNAVNKKGNKVCLRNDSGNDKDYNKDCIDDSWTLDKFYGEKKANLNENGCEEGCDAGNNTTYYGGGQWYTINDDGSTSDLNSGQNHTTISVETLKEGTVQPETEIKRSEVDNKDEDEFQITRTYTIDGTKVNGNDKTFSYTWSKDTTPSDTVLAPALYKVTYDICTDVKYKAEIDYINKDTKEEVHEPYKKDDLSNGDKDSVDSPKVDGCTLVDKNDSTVDYTIDNTDYQKTVYYTCKAESPAVNPKTGNALIFVAWVVGLGSLGYSIYWFKKNKKEEV